MSLPDLTQRPGEVVVISGDEAHHAVRVKRLGRGDALELLDGRGHIARAVASEVERTREGWVVRARVESVRLEPELAPAIEVWASVPKGERVEEMIDALAQAGADAWAPLGCERSVVTPRAGKVSRLARRAAEASKQCGRAWEMRLLEGGSVEQALAGTHGTRAVFADASGEPYQASGDARIRVLIGPEGGWAERELELARSHGARIARFGPHAMRIETAAVVACAIVLDAEAWARGA